MSKHENHGISTRAVHAGYEPNELGAVNPPIVQSSTFAFKNANHGAELFSGKGDGFIYTRIGNPSITALEDNVAALEGGARGMACATGMGAVNTLLFGLLAAGDHIVITDSVYGATRVSIDQYWSKFGVEYSAVNSAELDEVRQAMRPNTKLVFIETPANPTLKVTDIAGCAEIAHSHGAKLVVDNTFMSPVLQRPFEHGADIVMHSITKFINGHSDVVGGVLVYKDEADYELLRKPWFNLGATMDPHQAYLVYRGVKTLKLRVLAAQANARQVADMLAAHPKVEWVSYPGLNSHGQRELHARQADGPGSLISFGVRGGIEAGKRLMDSVELMTLAVSLGGVESLIQHPASMTHAAMTPEQRTGAGITDGMVRLSVGCEDLADIIADLEQALDKS